MSVVTLAVEATLLSLVLFVVFLWYVLACKAIYQKKQAPQIVIRHPYLLLGELTGTILVIIGVSVYQILLDAGLGIPCYVIIVVGWMDIVVVYLYLHKILRYLELTVSSPQKVDESIKKTHTFVACGTGLSLLVLALLEVVGALKPCRSSCNQPGCWFLSNYFIMLPAYGLLFVAFAALLPRIKDVNFQNSRLNLHVEVNWLIQLLPVLLTPAIILLLLSDFQVLQGPVWPRLYSFYIIFCRLYGLAISVVIPSLLGGFSPLPRRFALMVHRKLYPLEESVQETQAAKNKSKLQTTQRPQVLHTMEAALAEPVGMLSPIDFHIIRRPKETPNVGAARGKVKVSSVAMRLDWLNVEEVFKNPILFSSFISFCKTKSLEREANFLADIMKFQGDVLLDEARKRCAYIVARYLEPGGTMSIAMPSNLRDRTMTSVMNFMDKTNQLSNLPDKCVHYNYSSVFQVAYESNIKTLSPVLEEYKDLQDKRFASV